MELLIAVAVVLGVLFAGMLISGIIISQSAAYDSDDDYGPAVGVNSLPHEEDVDEAAAGQENPSLHEL